MKNFVLGAIPIIVVAVMFSGCGYMIGKDKGWSEGYDHRGEIADDVCCPGETRSCVFGPAIVGVKTCRYSWSGAKCEPDPRYRVTAVAP